MSAIPQQLAASNRVRAHSLGYRAVLLALVVVACGMAASTYSVFSHTWDEPEHLAAGLALLDTGKYPYDSQHPPLARIAMALGPYLAGARSYGNPGPSGEKEGRDILYGPVGNSTDHYDRYLMLARVGMLPFLMLLVVSTWLWTRHTFGAPAAVVATGLVVATPVLIGHAAVAALDIPMVGTTVFALYLLMQWFEALSNGATGSIQRPSLRLTLAMGVAVGVAAATKLSAIPFVGCAGIVWLAAATLANPSFLRGDGEKSPLPAWLIGHVVAAFVAALSTLIACYGFSLEPFSVMHPFLVPAGVPRLLMSLRTLTEHNSAGHLSFFMGELKRSGWWDFYLVALAVKTPIALLLTAMAGSIWFSLRSLRERSWTLAAPTLAFASILLFCSAYSHINIGVRHVLILFPLLAITAGAFIVAMWRRFQHLAVRAALIALCGWQCINVVAAHPDYLAYFNEFAGAHPEKILIDSDLDWGQDLRRLRQALAERKVDHFAFIYRGTADLDREGLPHNKLLWPRQRATGWIAVSLLARATGSEDGGYDWLNAYTPVARVGKSIDLYYIETRDTRHETRQN